MKIILKTGWKKCGHYRVRTLVKEDAPSAFRKIWFRRIVASSSREDGPESPNIDS